MTENKNITLTPTETQTYIHLGIIAANTGYREMLFWQNQQVASGDRDPSVDVGAWFAEQVARTEDLSELYSFRNRLLHGSVIVDSDGSIQVFDRKEHTQRRYTADEIRQYASRFYHLRFENRVTLTGTTYLICSCGAEFQQPQGSDEYQEHRDNCPVYQQRMRELSDNSAEQD